MSHTNSGVAKRTYLKKKAGKQPSKLIFSTDLWKTMVGRWLFFLESLNSSVASASISRVVCHSINFDHFYRWVGEEPKEPTGSLNIRGIWSFSGWGKGCIASISRSGTENRNSDLLINSGTSLVDFEKTSHKIWPWHSGYSGQMRVTLTNNIGF